MRNLKRALSLGLTAAMISGLMVMGSSAAGYADVTSENNQEAIEVLQAVGIMTGVDEEGNFNPEGTVTRNQMAVIMANLMEYNVASYRDTSPFTDVPSWAEPYVAACYTNGITSGYSDTIYGGEDSVTTAQAALMLMKALGYFQYASDFGQDWQLSTLYQGNLIDLFVGVDSRAEDPLTRNDVAQLVLNTLKAGTVQASTSGSLEIGGVVINSNVEYNYITSNANYATAISSDQSTNANTDAGRSIVELGESLYMGDLKLEEYAKDDFGRPARYWEYNGEEIGTYAKTELLKQSYTAAVTGRDLYDLLGSTIVNNYSFNIYVDGIDDTDVNPDIFSVADINRNNRGDLDSTGNGVLTEVYVDTDEKVREVTIAVINTYLAIADGDYNESRDQVTFDVYNIYEDADENYIKNDSHDERMTITSEDFAFAPNIVDGDAYLVNVAAGEIQMMAEPEILSEVEISSFSVGNHLTVDGTKYNYAETARYDVETLSDFTNIQTGTSNLKDATYNVYVDSYGYMIGVKEVDPADNYLFITGIDNDYSNLAARQAKANAIFLDGRMETITVNTVDSKNLESAWGYKDNATINSWFTYTVNSNDVYTVSLVDTGDAVTDATIGNAAQYRTDADYSDKIDDENIDLPGAPVGDDYEFVYGNDDSIYLTASVTEINSRDGQKDRVIDDVISMTVGIDNTSIEVWDKATAQAKAHDSDITGTLNENEGSYGVYTLYDDEAYVIAAVVVGDDGGTNSDYVYVNSSDTSVTESYDKNADEWTWTRDVLINGEVVTLKEVSDVQMSYLENMDRYKWDRVTYNADGEVKEATSFDTTVDEVSNPTPDTSIADLMDDKKPDVFDDWYDEATNSSRLPTDHAAITKISLAPDLYGDSEVIVYHHTFNNKVPTVNKARTFYVDTTDNTGVRVDSEVNVVFIQTNDNRTTTEYGTGIDFLEDVIADLHEATSTPTYNYQVAMLIENARATTVIIRDTVDTYETPVVVTDHHVTASYDGFHTFVITIDDGCTPNNVEIANAIKAELTSSKWDCSDVSVKFDGNNKVTEVSFVTATGTPVTLNSTTGLTINYSLALEVNGNTVTVGPDTLANVRKLSAIQAAAGASGPWAKVTDRDGNTREADVSTASIGTNDVKVEFGYAKLTGTGVSGALTGWNPALSGIDTDDLFKKGDTFDVVVTNSADGVWGSEITDFTWTTTAPALFKVTGAELTDAGSASDPAVITLHIEVIATPTSSQQCVVTA